MASQIPSLNDVDVCGHWICNKNQRIWISALRRESIPDISTTNLKYLSIILLLSFILVCLVLRKEKIKRKYRKTLVLCLFAEKM